jgi:arylsulfatase A-like enzyme/cytochrome c-type biogenesis protein CcmH/NrfG
MKASLPLCLILAAFISHSAAQNTTKARKASSRPDVFLITIDTLRADHVHCYGDQQIATPTLDSLAAKGIRFTSAFTPSPITNTSHTTILTGLLPSSHGVTDFAIPLDPNHVTLAELLKQSGFHTAAFIGAVILDSNGLAPGLNRGFDFYDNFPQHTQSKSRWGRVERRGMDVVQHAEKWLDAHPSGPRFAWIHLYDPHDPYEPPPPYSVTYKDRLYDGEIAYADAALGQFLDYLKKTARLDNALVIVVGDHGEGLGEHQEDTHGIFLYDSTTHVPLIVKLPAGARAGSVVQAQVRTTDLLPTVLDLLAIDSTAKFDGESLAPYINGKETGDRVAFGETDYPLRFGWAPLRSVRQDGFKLIKAPRPELYDLKTDPGELHNAYSTTSPQVQKLSQTLAQLPTPQTASQASTTSETPALPDPKDKIQEQNLLHTAMLASEDGHTEQARAALEKVLQLDEHSPTALLQLGQLELAAGNAAKAADYLRRARQARPEDATAALDYARALEMSGDLPHARDALDAALKMNPDNFSGRLRLGNLCLRTNDPKAAEDQFEAALLVQPNNAEAQLGLAKAMIAQDQFADAAHVLESIKPADNPDVFDLLSQAYSRMGKTQQAQHARQQAEALRGKRK